MDVLSKIVTALKGGLNEAGEAIVDSQALRILEQEIRESIDELNHTKDSLASMIARGKLAEEKVAKFGAEIAENEGYAIKAMAQSDERLSMDLAAKIAELEGDLEREQASVAHYKKSADQLRAVIAKSERDVQYMQTQLDTVKATENVQKAEAAVSKRLSGSNSKLRTAMESLERIKEKQAQAGARIEAARELAFEANEPSLEQRLIDAGIKESHNAEDVLKRLKQT